MEMNVVAARMRWTVGMLWQQRDFDSAIDLLYRADEIEAAIQTLWGLVLRPDSEVEA